MSKNALPADALRFAKQMGIDLQGLEPEAREIWNQLNALSMENPIEYERFVSEQMQLAKEEGEKNPSESKARSFRPTAAFCLESESFGGDGGMIRDASSNSGNKTLFVNFCSSPIIEQPRDKQGRPVDLNCETADGLEIPLVIGKVRKFNTNTNAVDIVFGMKVIELCNNSRYFKQQIIELGLNWLETESELRFDKQNYKEDKKITYKGGLGENHDTPVLFHVEEEMLQPPEEKAKNASKPSKNVLESPKSLLSQLGKEEDVAPPEIFLKEAAVTKKPFIQEVGVKEAESATKKSLFQEIEKGEGKSSVTNIQTKSIEKNDSSVAIEKHIPSSKELKKFQEIFGAFDQELGATVDSQATEEQANNLLTDLAKAISGNSTLFPSAQLNNTASKDQIAPPAPPVVKESFRQAKQPTDNLVVSNPRPDIIKLTAEMLRDNATDSHNLTIVLSNLCSTVQAASIQLHVSSNEVRIHCPFKVFVDHESLEQVETISLSLQSNQLVFNPSKAKASLRRKKGEIVFTVGCDRRK